MQVFIVYMFKAVKRLKGFLSVHKETYSWLGVFAILILSALTIWQLNYVKATDCDTPISAPISISVPCEPPISTPVVSPSPSAPTIICAQVITRACEVDNPNNCQEFGSSCIPSGWTTNIQPKILSLYPTSAKPGDKVKVSGSNFNNSSKVYLNNVEMPGEYEIAADGSELTFTLTKEVSFEANKRYSLVVNTNNGQSNTEYLTVAPGFLTDSPTALNNQSVLAEVVNVTTQKPEVVLGSVNFDSTVYVPSSVNGVLLNASNMTFPYWEKRAIYLYKDIKINSTTSLGSAKLELPGALTISGLNWSGLIAALTVLDKPSVNIPASSGYETKVSAVVEVGVGNTSLNLDKAARIVLPNQAGKLAGFVKDGKFNKITTECSADTQTAGDSLPALGDCKINQGLNLVIWAKHFTEFITYTESKTSTSVNQTSNNESSVSTPSAAVCSDAKPSSAPALLSAKATGKNEVTLVWSKAKDPVTYYLVSYGTQKGVSQYGNPNVGNTTTYTVKNLSGNTTYYFKVRAGNHCMPGDFSNEVAVKVYGAKVSTPAEGFKAGVLAEANVVNSEKLVDQSARVEVVPQKFSVKNENWMLKVVKFLAKFIPW